MDILVDLGRKKRAGISGKVEVNEGNFAFFSLPTIPRAPSESLRRGML